LRVSPGGSLFSSGDDGVLRKVAGVPERGGALFSRSPSSLLQSDTRLRGAPVFAGEKAVGGKLGVRVVAVASEGASIECAVLREDE
jgi:hypothetical protein